MILDEIRWVMMIMTSFEMIMKFFNLRSYKIV